MSAEDLKPLSEIEFQATFTVPMTDITTSAEEVVDVWPYIETVLDSEYKSANTEDWDVDHVYINQTETHQHLLINTGMKNVYLVVVIAVAERQIYGHHLLNLNQNYGIAH